MVALDRKLMRDLWRLRGQVLAIAMIVASGVAVLVMSLAALEALEETAVAYYERYRFADVFANVKRAPERLAGRVAAIPGVQAVETRIVKLATLDVAGFAEPVVAQLVSIPERGRPMLNRLAMRAGRHVTPGHPNEAILSEPFAETHGLRPGDRIEAIMNGHKRKLEIVGIALSPEYVYAIGPGALMPDKKRYGIVWMGREALAAAYDLDAAFNDVSLSLLRGVQPDDVVKRLDQLLERYGGIGAYERRDQISNWFLMNEIEQLKSLASMLPIIFLAAAAFLTNMVLARLIAIERSEIGLLKAFGYRDRAVAWHYMKMAIAMTGLGIAIGWALGYWLGRFTTANYAELFRFPFLIYDPGPKAFAGAAIVSLGASMIGALGAARRASAMPPAEAMQPPAPPQFRKSRLAGAVFGRWLDQPTRVFLRQIARWPLRAFLTATGISMAVAVLVTSLQWLDAIDHMIDVYFFQAQHQDMTVGLVEAQSSTAVQEFARMPGVLSVEPKRVVGARMHAGHRSKRLVIQGVSPDAHLEVIYDAAGRIVQVPPEGLVLSTKLAQVLGVRRGESVTVEILEGRRPVLRVPVVELFETYIGTPAYMHIDALNRLMRERPSLSEVHLLVDERERPSLYAELKELPEVSAVMLRQAAVDIFDETMAETLMIYISYYIAFACTLAFGVVYNSARIGLSERGRELATLRVLGFSRLEISYILLGETALVILAALPLGCIGGRALTWAINSAFETELYRVPLIIEASTYGVAVLVGLVATALSAVLVRRRLDRLDLIAVLKTRE